ncbi:hypothetical protein ACQUJS_03060 [Ralstonia pseudosolanacearum]|uniref:Uncharacterized protein n=1 Tax=Ralstonia solanacearum TaxID=305 RepID=A0A0S4TX92_RALSL|nr:conserved protein of unknown function [Ralstonia solanacearum]
MTVRFKAGDRIRAMSETTRDIKNGNVYVVTGIDGEGWLMFLDDAGDERCRPAHRYTLVEPAPSPSLDLLDAMMGKPLKFRSGCAVTFVAFVKDAKPHCQLVLLNPATGNVVTRYANGKGSEEPYDEPGDILLA